MAIEEVASLHQLVILGEESDLEPDARPSLGDDLGQ